MNAGECESLLRHHMIIFIWASSKIIFLYADLSVKISVFFSQRARTIYPKGQAFLLFCKIMLLILHVPDSFLKMCNIFQALFS